MKPQLLLLAMLFATTLSVNAQVSISNNNSAPDPSAMLDVKSTTRGVLLPRMTNAERDAIVNPVPGLMIFNSDEKEFQYYEGLSWRSLAPGFCQPPPPASINGNGFPGCNATGTIYSIGNVPNASYYRWTVPDGAVISSGQGTTEITVGFGTENGNVSVRAEGGCGNSAYTDLPITIAIPEPPFSIYGKDHPDCNEPGAVYYVDPVPGAANYNWTVSPGATIAGGQGTNSITVDFSTMGGEISVRTENSCGNSSYISMSYNIGIPAQPGSITGTESPYKNSTGVPYFIIPVPGATSYHWTVPFDATIADGQGTDSITVNFGIQSGNISLMAQNSCGNSVYTDLPVVPFACGEVITDSRDSQTYPTVQIGTQCWMARNMNIGARINIDVPQSQQFPEVIEKYCYNNVEDSCSIYGGFYQWNEMMQYETTEGARGICPAGWHVPSDAEWCTLENYLDSDTVDCNRMDFGGTDAGGKMKEAETAHWASPNTGATNSSGFSALAAGCASSNQSSGIRQTAYLWTSTASWNAVIRSLSYSSSQIYRYPYYFYSNGFSVRCVR